MEKMKKETNMFSFFKRYKKTDFEAGGLILTPPELPRDFIEVKALRANSQFVAPAKIDFRDMCLPSNNQYQTPHCAGYATAGFCELVHWRTKHFPQQLDGDAIYAEAKKIDGKPQVQGTWLWSATQAAINLGFIQGEGRDVPANKENVQFAIHQYGICIAGFNITEDWNFVDKNTGRIKNTPGSKTRGGHAVDVVGWDDYGFILQNSWGEEWGIKGFATLSWEQFSNQLMYARVIVT
jgi:hypothetical protein